MRDNVQVKRTFIVTPTSLPSFPTVRRQIWTMATSVIKVIIFCIFCIVGHKNRGGFRVRDPRCLSWISIFSIPDPGFVSKNLSILGQKIKISDVWSGLFIPDPDPDCLPNQDPGSRGQKGSRSRIRIRIRITGRIWIRDYQQSQAPDFVRSSSKFQNIL